MGVADGVGLLYAVRLGHAQCSPHLARRDRGDAPEFRRFTPVEHAFAVEEDLLEAFGRAARFVDGLVFVLVTFADDLQGRSSRVLMQPSEEVSASLLIQLSRGLGRIRLTAGTVLVPGDGIRHRGGREVVITVLDSRHRRGWGGRGRCVGGGRIVDLVLRDHWYRVHAR